MKRNPQDSTLRNVRAAVKRVDAVLCRLKRAEQQIEVLRKVLNHNAKEQHKTAKAVGRILKGTAR